MVPNAADLMVIWSAANADNRTLALADVAKHVVGTIVDVRPDFILRTDFVARAPTLAPAVGRVINAAGYTYRYIGTGTAIIDLPGWVPHGESKYSHWGAAGDGVTDDTVKIQAAIDYAATAGFTVDGEFKTYRVTAAAVYGGSSYCIEARGGLTLHSTRFTFTQTAVSTDILITKLVGTVDTLTVENLVIRDFIINGNALGLTTPGGVAGMNYRFRTVKHLTLDNVGSINPSS